MQGSFEGRTVLVTGGASGIGRACVRLLAGLGASVISLDRNRDDEGLSGTGAQQVEMDVCDRAALEALCRDLEGRGVHVGALVNSAGILQPPVAPSDLASDVFRRVLAVDLEGTFNACAVFGSAMAARGGGAIVNIASIAGMRSMPLHAYAPAKAGVISLTEGLAAEWGRSGVRVNAVSPGFTLTEALQAEIDAGRRDPARLAENTCLGTLVGTGDVAQAVAFLLSDAARMITGANLPVDAGWLAAGSWQGYGGVRGASS